MVLQDKWSQHRFSNREEDSVWELFHENSKVGRFDDFLSQEEILDRMNELHQALPYHQYSSFELPTVRTPLKQPLDEVMQARVSARNPLPSPLSLEDLSTLLHHAYGVTRWNQDTLHPRPFRVVPSGGALYPMEVYFYTKHVQGIPSGVYHYNPMENMIYLLQRGEFSRELSASLVDAQNHLASNTSVLFFITAVFERSTFKYGPRGYRFILLEAGHIAQNLNLVATAMDLCSLNIGGFYDRKVDAFLRLDGINQSTVYMVGVCKNAEDTES